MKILERVIARLFHFSPFRELGTFYLSSTNKWSLTRYSSTDHGISLTHRRVWSNFPRIFHFHLDSSTSQFSRRDCQISSRSAPERATVSKTGHIRMKFPMWITFYGARVRRIEKKESKIFFWKKFYHTSVIYINIPTDTVLSRN